MAKIGIYTLFYNSINYGGILQAYALNRVIREADNDCEVLNFNYDYSIDTRSRIKIQLKKGIFSFIKKSCLHVFNKNKFKKYSVLAKGRREAFKEFVDKNIAYLYYFFIIAISLIYFYLFGGRHSDIIPYKFIGN